MRSVDIAPIVKQVEAALAAAGPMPWLVAYDASGIQEYIHSSHRPKAMQGASRIIARFDREQRRPLTIFAGGGRALELAPTEAAARARTQELPHKFKQVTGGCVLAAACVPLDRRHVRESYALLKARLDLAKDATPPLGGELPRDKRSQCSNCRLFHAEHIDSRPDHGEDRICRRCQIMQDEAGADARTSLIALSPSRRIAAVSADGNNLGDFFAKLDTLPAIAAASAAIHAMFDAVQIQASSKLRHLHIPLVGGGDDIKIFLAAEDLLVYVQALVATLEREATNAGTLGGLLPSGQTLATLGIAIGAVVADDRYPAARLITQAHTLERSSKTQCGRGDPAMRSAFDVAVLSKEDPFAADGSLQRSAADFRPLDMAEARFIAACNQAHAFNQIPTAQRALLAEAHTLEPAEFANLFRYQVARSDPWQAYLACCGIDWRNPDTLCPPPPGLSVLADLVELGGKP